MSENLNKTVKRFTHAGKKYEVDLLTDQKDWNGPGTNLYHLFDDNNKFVDEFQSVKEAESYIKEPK